MLEATDKTFSKKCLHCSEIIIPQNVRHYRKQKFCSKKCSALFYGEDKRKQLIELNAKREKATGNCVVCEKVFFRPPSYAKNTVTCSKFCSSIRRSDTQKGELSHLWRGGKTSANGIFRESFSYDNWRKSVFERDDWRCQICFERGGKITAHHILKFSEHPEYRIDINNGISLCWNCHKKIKNKEKDFTAHFFFMTGGIV